jgi:hypothetical protein
MWKEDVKVVKAINFCIEGKKYVGTHLGKKCLLHLSIMHRGKLIVGQGSDAGGGRVGKTLYVCLKRKGRTAEIYLIATRSLHGLQLVLGNATEACSSSEGLLKCNVLQKICTMYQIQGKYKIGQGVSNNAEAKYWSLGIHWRC